MDPSVCVYCLRSENPEISVRCGACKSSMHFKCIGLSPEEISFFKKPHSTNIKIICTRCNITPLNVMYVNTLLTRFQQMIVQRLEDLQEALEMYLMAISMQREDAEPEELEQQEDNLADANIPNNLNDDDDNVFAEEFMADLNAIVENEEPANPPVNQNDDDGNKVVQLNFPPSPINNNAEVDVPPPNHNFQAENIVQHFYNYKNLILTDLRHYMEDIQASIASMTA